MPEQPVLVAATNELLVDLIERAVVRLVIVAPALSLTVAKAAARCWERLGPDDVSVTLDVDPEVYRLGYGDVQSLELLEATGARLGGMLQRQRDVRIGILISDDVLLTFAPIPELVAAGPRTPQSPNAVMIGSPPAALEAALGVGPSKAAEQEVGLDKATKDDIASVTADLAGNPPQRFDVSRAVRVFNTAFQFVELEMVGTAVTRLTANLPDYVTGIVDVETRKRLRTTYALVAGSSELSGESLRMMRQLLERRYFKTIPRFGQVLLRSDKGAFEAHFKLLQQAVEAFKLKCEDSLQAELKLRVDELTKELLPRLSASPPAHWLLARSGQQRATECERCLREDLSRAIGSATRYTDKMQASVVFKDVTIESLRNASFVAAARKAFPGLQQLHQAFDAAPESSQGTQGRVEPEGA